MWGGGWRWEVAGREGHGEGSKGEAHRDTTSERRYGECAARGRMERATLYLVPRHPPPKKTVSRVEPSGKVGSDCLAALWLSRLLLLLLLFVTPFTLLE